MKHLFVIAILTLSNFICAQNRADMNSDQNLQNLEVLLAKRMELYSLNENYLPIELKMIENGHRFPALVVESNDGGKKIVEFKAYIITPSNLEDIKASIMQGVPSIENVTITGNHVKATFNANADFYHIQTLFRLLGYNSFTLQN